MKKMLRQVKAILFCTLLLVPSSLLAQTSKPREFKVGYPLGGSTGFFWVAHRSGSFEKYGLKLEPIYIRGGLMGIQAALSGDLLLQLQGASTVVAPGRREGKISNLSVRWETVSIIF
jgi:ABC-type nitrate/sulfonate/bicarbonate transport system substrate-binding protein